MATSFRVSLLLSFVLIPACVLGASFNCSEPPNFRNYDVNTCCRVPEINLADAPSKCDKYISSLKKEGDADHNYPSYTHVCYPDCIYRETGSLVKGEFQMESVEKFLQRSVHRRDRDIVPHIVHAFQACLSNIKGHMKAVSIKAYPVLAEGCSPYASMIFSCVNAETFLHCPAKMWKNDRTCNFARAFAQQCNPLPHVPLPIA